MKSLLQVALVGILSAVGGAWIYGTYLAPEPTIIHTPSPTPKNVVYETPLKSSNTVPRKWLSSSPTDFTSAAHVSTPSVVFIETKTQTGYNFWMSEDMGSSSGSGVIISPDGYVVTNNHVINEADEVKVMLNDNREFAAQVIGTDPTTDLALLKIEGTNLSYLPFGDSDSLQIGEWVLAVGNPFKLQSTVTAGIVSAMGRNINILRTQKYSIESFIQTDAVVNPGNSGGALVNTNGELIGINTAIISNSGQYAGYSFAIPSNLTQKVVNDLREFGTVQRGLLGVQITDVTANLADELDLPEVSGVHVGGVFPGGAAADAQLQRGDVIVAINDIRTPSIPILQEQIARYRPGNEVTIDYIRNGENERTSVMLKNQINTTEPIVVRKDEILRKMGAEIRDLSPSEKSQLRTEGVKILSIKEGSILDRINMIPDYIVTHVNGEPIYSSDQFIQYIDVADSQVRLEGFYEKYNGDFPYSFEKSDLPQ